MPSRIFPEHCPRHAHGDDEVDPVYDRAAGAELAAEMKRRLIRMAIITNTAGAVLVCGFLAFLIPVSIESLDRGEEVRLIIAGAVFGAVYLVVTFAIGNRWSERIGAPAYEWLEAGRAPDLRERELAVRMPLRLAIVSVTFWTVGALLIAALMLIESADLASIAFDSVLLGGVTTCALEYLMTERLWRPVVALALLDDSPTHAITPGIRARLTTAWALATGVPLIGIFAIGSAGIFGMSSHSAELLPGAVMFLSIVAITTGLLATKLVARSVAEPVATLRRALARIEKGELDTQVPVDDGSEIGLLQAGFNRMASELREQERLQELFGRHVGRDVATAALRGDLALGGEVREVGVLFVDLVGSTAMSEELPPDEVVSLLNAFFTTVVDAVAADGGWVNKFEGDAALCIFGAPVDVADPAGSALCAARSLRKRLRAELPGLHVGIGVSAGPVVAGNIGAQERCEYTVIGDPVNEAARLSELAKARPDRLLASSAALERADEAEAGFWATDGAVQLRGRRRPTTLAILSPAIPAPLTSLSASPARRQPATRAPHASRLPT